MHEERAGAWGACAAAAALAGAVYVGAQRLAARRVALDTQFAVATETEAAARASPRTTPPRRLCASPAADGVVCVQVYWPTTLVPAESAEVHGWCMDGGPGEVVVVVAGVRPRDATRALPGLRCVGTCAAAPARVRRARDVDLHMRPGPTLAWYVLC